MCVGGLGARQRRLQPEGGRLIRKGDRGTAPERERLEALALRKGGTARSSIGKHCLVLESLALGPDCLALVPGSSAV